MGHAVRSKMRTKLEVNIKRSFNRKCLLSCDLWCFMSPNSLMFERDTKTHSVYFLLVLHGDLLETCILLRQRTIFLQVS